MLPKFIDEEITYTGEQLQSLWAYRNFDIKGDSIIAFIGKCHVKISDIVDVEDVKKGATIYSESMLHFIVEHFDMDLEKTVYRQRLLMAIMGEELNSEIGENRIHRLGDDLYDEEAKLTVSIATLSPVSTLIHSGINISSKNTPVETKGLEELNIDPHTFADIILKRYVRELESIYLARCKVRSVK